MVDRRRTAEGMRLMVFERVAFLIGDRKQRECGPAAPLLRWRSTQGHRWDGRRRLPGALRTVARIGRRGHPHRRKRCRHHLRQCLSPDERMALLVMGSAHHIITAFGTCRARRAEADASERQEHPCIRSNGARLGQPMHVSPGSGGTRDPANEREMPPIGKGRFDFTLPMQLKLSWHGQAHKRILRRPGSRPQQRASVLSHHS